MKSYLKPSKSNAKKIAKRAAEESVEIVKTAKKQSFGNSLESIENRTQNNANESKIGEQKDREQSKRLVDALEEEIKDIRVQKEIQQKRKDKAEEQNKESKKAEAEGEIQKVVSKPSRKLGGIKKHISGLAQKTEKRKSPSG